MSEAEQGREIASFDDLHALPPDAVVVDVEGNEYRRNRKGLWANTWGYFPMAGELTRLMPLRVGRKAS